MSEASCPGFEYQLAVGKEEAVSALRDLKAKFERGEITCAALRIYRPDGSWEDRVIGGVEDEEGARTLADLQCLSRRAN